ncbi:unnamed protein product [Menidia menidia]|uniref:riboflavin kinase n=1 Tax=Menidia menidia TaxID=238744 RepID=A0A8S4B5U1_9TELE|nr:unnamed protein product [Menidia menidia]
MTLSPHTSTLSNKRERLFPLVAFIVLEVVQLELQGSDFLVFEVILSLSSQPAVKGRLVMKSLPYFCRGEVIRGFGRGSKELGIPTANFPDSVVDNLPSDINTGIYYGWACVGNGDVYKMVMSIGWNPYYKNTKKSMASIRSFVFGSNSSLKRNMKETHVIHKFKEDFYGEILSVVMVGYIRPERTYDSLVTLSLPFFSFVLTEALIAAINNDIEESKQKLEVPEHRKLKDDNFFTSTASSTSVSPSTAASTSQTILNGH